MTALEAQWVPAKQFILGDDPQLRVFGEILLWQRKLNAFRKGEDDRMFVHDPTPEDLQLHKSLLERLIADGQYLLELVQQVGLPDNDDGITRASTEATVELLRADYRGWHQPLPRAVKKGVLTKIFPDVA